MVAESTICLVKPKAIKKINDKFKVVKKKIRHKFVLEKTLLTFTCKKDILK